MRLMVIIWVAAIAIALGASTAAPATNGPLTCIRKGTQLIGCLRRITGAHDSVWSGGACGVVVWGHRTDFVFAGEGLASAGGPPDAYAKQRDGSWTLGAWHGRKVGRAVPAAANAWLLLSPSGAELARVNGPDPEVVGLVFLFWGKACFPK